MKRFFWLIGFVLFTAFFAKAQNDTIIFSVPGGFYDNVFALRLMVTSLVIVKPLSKVKPFAI